MPQANARSQRSVSLIENDLDADADDDNKENGDQEDQELYCYCRKLSYGEVRLRFPLYFLFAYLPQMVGCDNPDCPYQWFHLSCTGIKGPLPESWYCTDCAPKFQFTGPSDKVRKGRKPRT